MQVGETMKNRIRSLSEASNFMQELYHNFPTGGLSAKRRRLMGQIAEVVATGFLERVNYERDIRVCKVGDGRASWVWDGSPAAAETHAFKQVASATAARAFWMRQGTGPRMGHA